MPAFDHTQPEPTIGRLGLLCRPYANKLAAFRAAGYKPHLYQLLFHTIRDPDTQTLCRYRALCAGRRGGKTLAAAHEVVHYVGHPQEFWMDYYGIDSVEPLHGWVVSKDLVVGRAALLTLRRILAQHPDRGLWSENRSEKYLEHENGGLVEMKTAVDPQSLRGMGLNLMWLDEAAFIPSREAYDVATPALSDKEGVVLATTTPDGKNWFYREFFQPSAADAHSFGTVSYRSIDNPHFSRQEWVKQRRSYHPLLFRQEYEASFEAMAGKELAAAWLSDNFYEPDDLTDKRGQPLEMHRYVGIDPAISLSRDADYFAACCWGVLPYGGAFLLDTFEGRIPFPEQLDFITAWQVKHRPMIIGVEATAYQAALAQAAMRLDTLPPIAEIHTQGKKRDRILSMSAAFRVGRARVARHQGRFIERWVSYDSTKANPEDDLLDAAEIGLRCAGVLYAPTRRAQTSDDERDQSLQAQVWRQAKTQGRRASVYDPDMGADF